MTKTNTTLVQALMISRAKNYIIVLCIPNFFMLDKYIRDHRVNCLIHITKRGKYWFYDRNKAEQLSKKGYKFMNHTAEKYLFRGDFNKAFATGLSST